MLYNTKVIASLILASNLFLSCDKTPVGPPAPGNETADYVVSTFAGSGQAGLFDALGTSARFTSPTALAIDFQNNIFVVDAGNFSIRKITAGGMVTTLAGGQQGYADGSGAAAQFYSPASIAADAAGNVYVADAARIRKITSVGVVTTIAGSTTQGYADGVGSAALFTSINSITVDPQGNVIALDKSLPDNRIRIVSPSGAVSTHTTVGMFSAQIAIDAMGNLFLYDAGILDFSIGKITPTKISTRYATAPQGIGMTITNGTIFLTGYKTELNPNAGANSYGVYKINAGTTYTLIAGDTRAGFLDGAASTAKFNNASGLVADTQGNLFIADRDNNRIRKVSRR